MLIRLYAIISIFNGIIFNFLVDIWNFIRYNVVKKSETREAKTKIKKERYSPKETERTAP